MAVARRLAVAPLGLLAGRPPARTAFESACLQATRQSFAKISSLPARGIDDDNATISYRYKRSSLLNRVRRRSRCWCSAPWRFGWCRLVVAAARASAAGRLAGLCRGRFRQGRPDPAGASHVRCGRARRQGRRRSAAVRSGRHRRPGRARSGRAPARPGRGAARQSPGRAASRPKSSRREANLADAQAARDKLAADLAAQRSPA